MIQIIVLPHSSHTCITMVNFENSQPPFLYCTLMLRANYRGKGYSRKSSYETVVVKNTRRSNEWKWVIAMQVVGDFLIGF